VITLEQARKARPQSNWHATSTEHFLIEHVPHARRWVLWHTTQQGKRVDGFGRKRDALAVASAMAEHATTMFAVEAMPDLGDPARRALITIINDAYLEATRGVR